MYKEDVQTIVSEKTLTPRQAMPFEQPSLRQKVYAYALPLTRVSWNMLLLGAIVASFVMYWWMSSQLVSLGYSLEAAQKRVVQAQAENREWELAAMQEESFRIVNERVAELEMVEVGDIEYIEITTTNVARR